jgi:hypothetical protein
MHIAHAIIGHAVLTVIMLAALAALFLAVSRVDRTTSSGRRLGAPLDHELVARWNSGPTAA